MSIEKFRHSIEHPLLSAATVGILGPVILSASGCSLQPERPANPEAALLAGITQPEALNGVVLVPNRAKVSTSPYDATTAYPIKPGESLMFTRPLVVNIGGKYWLAAISRNKETANNLTLEPERTYWTNTEDLFQQPDSQFFAFRGHVQRVHPTNTVPWTIPLQRDGGDVIRTDNTKLPGSRIATMSAVPNHKIIERVRDLGIVPNVTPPYLNTTGKF